MADSPSGLAREMRQEIATDLRAGEAPEQIRARFAASYGEWILLDTPKRGLDLFVWAAPLALLAGGLVIAGLAIRRWTGGDPAPPGGQAAHPPGEIA